MKTARKPGRKHIQCRGAAVVEAAIVLTLLILITLGIMGFGWLFLRVQQITNAARHGARIAVRYNNNTDVLLGQVQTGVDNCLTPVGLVYTGPVIPTGVNPGRGEPVTVTVTGTGLDILALRGGFGPLPADVFPDSYSASVTMAKEGP